MDTFPDLGSLSDQELKDLIQQLTEEEVDISYRRRILHGKIDILRAELVNRLRKKHEGGEEVITGDDVQQLTDILAGTRRGRPTTRSPDAGSGRAWRATALSAGSSTPTGANYCQKCGAFLGARRREQPGASRRRRPTASARPASSSRSTSTTSSSSARRRARDPRRRRPRGGELPARSATA